MDKAKETIQRLRKARRNIKPVVTKATVVMTDKRKVIPRKQKYKS